MLKNLPEVKFEWHECWLFAFCVCVCVCVCVYIRERVYTVKLNKNDAYYAPAQCTTDSLQVQDWCYNSLCILSNQMSCGGTIVYVACQN